MKSTKIIAGLGVAAALGVAALPVATFAAQTTDNYTGSVKLSATIADELAITIDGNNMAKNSATPAAGTPVTFMTSDETPSENLSAGAFYKAGNTKIVVSTNVPNTYTLKANGTALTRADTSSIKQAGIVADDALAGGDNGSSYTGDSMWGIKVSATDKDSAAKTLTDGTSATVFNGAEKYMIAADDTIVDFAKVSASKITNTYSVEYGLGINADQSSGTYTGTANYTVTHVKGTE